MSEQESKFDEIWNAPKTQRIISIFYSLGASVVIVGAMGKILHTDWGGAMLGAGMTIEAILFAIGAFDKPHKQVDWHKVIDFDNGAVINSASDQPTAKRSVSIATESLSDADTVKLSEGIRKLTETANQLADLSNLAKSTDKLAKNIDTAAEATGKFIGSQEVLSDAATKLEVAYKSISDGIQNVDKNTKAYAAKVEDINKSLSSINSIYEIQIKNVQAQSETLLHQSNELKSLDANIGSLNAAFGKINSTSEEAAAQLESYKSGTEKLAKQIKDLNQVYGNMLNALN